MCKCLTVKHLQLLFVFYASKFIKEMLDVDAKCKLNVCVTFAVTIMSYKNSLFHIMYEL